MFREAAKRVTKEDVPPGSRRASHYARRAQAPVRLLQYLHSLAVEVLDGAAENITRKKARRRPRITRATRADGLDQTRIVVSGREATRTAALSGCSGPPC